MKRNLLTVLLITTVATAWGTDYYLDAGRISNGSGTAASPWKNWSDISWATIGGSLASGNVNLYCSSRGTWSPGGGQVFQIKTNNPSNWIKVVGDSQYNLTASGGASWSAETSTNNRALFVGGGMFGSGPFTNGWIQGVCISNASFDGIYFADQLPSSNIWNIVITNCMVLSDGNHGIWFGYAEAGCHDWTISHCTISNSPTESIYLGHYNYPGSDTTNVVVEYNTVVDGGLRDNGSISEGDIDIKPGLNGAIVRCNTHYRTVRSSGTTGTSSSCGVVCGANNFVIEGNVLFNQVERTAVDVDWGYGIFVNAEGDGAGNGQGITNGTIRNNLIYGNDNAGIKFIATTATASANISGVSIYNNTIVGNTAEGLLLKTSGARTVTISAMTNNMFVGNTNFDISLTGSVTISGADYNLYYRPSGNSWSVGGVSKTWAQWQTLGYDAHGLNVNPTLNVDYSLPSTSPSVDAGVAISGFNVDRLGTSRPRGAAWDIGAYEYIPPSFNAQVLNVGTLIRQ